MAQPKRLIGHEQDYPGSYKWPIYEVLCPSCKKWVQEYGDVDELINGEWHMLCVPCGESPSDEA